MHAKQNILKSPVFRLMYQKEIQGRTKYMKPRKKAHGKNEVYENAYNLFVEKISFLKSVK